MKTKIQLPTSTTQIGQQLLRHFNFTIAFDVNNPGPASHYPQFLATFNKRAELQRLIDMAEALDSGVKTLEFV